MCAYAYESLMDLKTYMYVIYVKQNNYNRSCFFTDKRLLLYV